MIIDKNVKGMYVGGSKILAVVHKNEIVWGHIEEKLKINIRMAALGADCTVEIERKDYALRDGRKRNFAVTKTEFTFIVKAAKNSRYNMVLNRKVIFKDEVGSPEGNKYTLSLDKSRTNNLYIDFKG